MADDKAAVSLRVCLFQFGFVKAATAEQRGRRLAEAICAPA